ncbi:ATP-binding cassette sub- C member 11 [Chamberlinius hualienensis]
MESTNTKRTWHEKYGTSLKMFLPFRLNKERNKTELNDEKVGCFSYASLNWLNGLMWKASRTSLNINRVKTVHPRNGIRINMEKLGNVWNQQIKNKKPENASLFKAICKFSMHRLILASVFISVMAICNYAGPTWVVRKMLTCLKDESIPISQGIIWASVFSVTQLIRHLMFNAFWVTSAYAGIRITGAIQGLIYNAILQSKSSSEIDIADIVSYVTTDLERVYQMLQSMILLVPPGFITITHIIYCYTLIGPWTLLGNSILLLYAPFMLFVTSLASGYRRDAAAMGDKRIGMIDQLLSNIKFIKMMAWEDVFFAKITDARKEETKSLEKAIILQSISWSSVVIAGNLAMVLSTIGYMMTGGVLDTIQVFSLMSGFAALSTPLGTVVLAVKTVSEGLVSCRRLQKFLINHSTKDTVNNSLSSPNAIHISHLFVSWSKCKISSKINDLENSNIDGRVNLAFESDLDDVLHKNCVLKNLNFSIQKGQLIGICGNIGSGKSTLLSTICGSTQIVKGRVIANGSIAFVAQQAWIFNGTIKENILLGLPFDKNRYAKVIDVCCLERDFQLMTKGDETEIGERGGNLSGGQKQRINLARAVYSNSDIYLMDDVFSAVDIQVAKSIFNNCIVEYLHDKSVLLVTHNIRLLDQADYILVMENGTIIEEGSHEDLIEKNQKYAQMFMKANEENVNKDKQKMPNVQPLNENPTESSYDGKMIKDEVDNKSSLSMKTLLYYCRQSGGYTLSFLLILTVALFAAASVFNNVWYKIWLSNSQHTKNQSNETTITEITLAIDKRNLNFHTYFTVYVCSMMGIFAFALCKAFLLRMTILRGNTQLHKQMYWKVVRSQLSFFHSTPIGRIINRFARDMDEVDVHIPSFGEYVGQTLLIVSFQAIIICILYPWFTIAIAIITAIFIAFDTLFSQAVQETKRMDNLLKPPIINHLNSTVQGIEVIRCYKKQQLFSEMFIELAEKHMSVYLQYQLSSKWLSFRIDIIGWIALTTLAMLIMSTKSSVSVINGGLSLVLLIQACIILSVAMRFKSELKAKMMSLERIRYYCTKLPEEGPLVISNCRPSKAWPSHGIIQFQNVFLKYQPETPPVLQGLNVTIKGGEKIGIIGRTGAGKSSIIQAILRLTELSEGSITIDNVNIRHIGLQDLRSQIAVIPQEPVICNGSIRWNLDPTNKYTDDEIWDALEKSHLKNKIFKEPNGLHETYNTNSGLFSEGEKQLFCLARALLKNSKILLLDEATANVDFETDSLIQTSIRNSFFECTVLTIAHRLNMIADYDKIMVMEAGKVIEFDTPSNLMQIDSHFRLLLNLQ